MRSAFAALFIAMLASTPVRATGDLAAMSVVQEDCAHVGDIAFGDQQRWAACRVTRGRWVATIDLVDLYQAQYCLGGAEGACEQRALMVFGNRAYTPVARLLVQRMDSGDSQYDDPQVVKNSLGRFMTLSAHLPDGASSSSHFLWQAGQWLPVDSDAWLGELAGKLPAGVTARQVGALDFNTDPVSAQAKLYRPGDADCCPSAGVARVELGLASQRFSLKTVSIAKE